MLIPGASFAVFERRFSHKIPYDLMQVAGIKAHFQLVRAFLASPIWAPGDLHGFAEFAQEFLDPVAESQPGGALVGFAGGESCNTLLMMVLTRLGVVVCE